MPVARDPRPTDHPEDPVTDPAAYTEPRQRPSRAVLLAGGGTAGHVNPLLAVAEELRSRDPELRVVALGTAEGLEARLVPERGIELLLVPKVPLPRRPTADWFRLPRLLRSAVESAGHAIDEIGAQVVVGFGGYVSTPAYLAARARAVPVVVHEQNARPGLANRLGSRGAAAVAITFPGTRLPRAQVTGLPLRPEIAGLLAERAADPEGVRRRAAAELGFEPDRVTLLVTGGSLGAVSVNTAVAAQAREVLATGAQVLHLTGAGKAESVRAAVRGVPGAERYHVREYLGEMEQALALADLVLCRAGAGTVSELAALGLPAVYVPLPVGNGEQRLNAQPVVAEGGGLLVADEDLSPGWIAEHLLPLLAPEAAEERAAMGAAAATVGVPDAAGRVADIVLDLVDAEVLAAEQRAAEAASAAEAAAEAAAASGADGAADDLDAADDSAPTEAAAGEIEAASDEAASDASDTAQHDAPGEDRPVPASDAIDAAEASEPVTAALPAAAVGATPAADGGERVAFVPGSAPVALADLGRVHLIGVGGAGMSAVAGLLLARGLTVSGSDAAEGPALDGLREAGVRVHVGHDASHVEQVDTLVVSSAIRATNPELVRARERGLRVLHRSEALAALMSDRIGIAVAGAHGKTTTSAMTATALAAVGREDTVLDPSFAIGGTVRTDDGPVPGYRAGAGDVFVAEADESDGSFLAYAPAVGVVTNVEPDHLDHYGTREAFEAAFEAFADRVLDGGALVACADDPGAARLVAAVDERLTRRGVRVLTYGTQDPAEGRPVDLLLGTVRAVDGTWRVPLTSRLPELPDLDLVLAVPGDHNAANAAAALLAGWAVGADPEALARGLAEFRGTGRRFEDRGTADGVRVVDDYAHHPTEVAALLRTARTLVGDGRVLVLFQPHLFSRTRTFAVEFGQALDLADHVVVTDVYAAREDPDPSTTGGTIVAEVPTPGRAEHVGDRHEAALAIARAARPGDLLLTVGAGDVTALAPVVLAALAEREAAAAAATPTPDGPEDEPEPEDGTPTGAV